MTSQSFAEYVALPGVHWSALRHIEQSPLDYKWHLDNPEPETDAMRLGRATHTAVLEPDRFLLEYVLAPFPDRRGTRWIDFVADHEDKTVLLEKDYQQCLNIRDAVRAHPVAGELLSGGESEKALSFTCTATGLVCKARVDHYWGRVYGAGGFPSVMTDLKTTGTFEPRMFAATAARFKYAHQLTFYREALYDNNLPVDEVKIICVQSVPPHDVIVYRVPDELLNWALGEVADLMRLLQKCERKDEWPGAAPRPMDLELPAWAYPDEEPLQLTKGGEPCITS